jgi:ABC-type dipeptide/oligopeptide/nickel transport system ATPase component
MACVMPSIRATADMGADESSILQIRGLTVRHDTPGGSVTALAGVDLDVHAGECLGIVGESGSGKTQLLLSILGLLPPQAHLGGSIRYRGTELLGMSAASLNRIRGARIAMIFQDPMTALNPYLRVIEQLSEVARLHDGISRREAEARALRMIEAVHIGEPTRRARQYPHELSGGMRQRIMVAMALMAEPEIILADEPTTALDVTVQAQVLALLQEVRERTGAALVLVTHDLGVVAQLADRIGVMRSGSVVELAECEALFDSPHHPYTRSLLASLPSLDPLP